MLEDLAAEMKQEQDRNEKISSSAVQSYGVNPDQHVNNVKLARKAGMPPALMPEISEDARLRVLLDQIDAAPPAVTRFVSDPENLKVSHDDVENMSLLEKSFEVLKNSARAIASSPWSTSQGLWSAPRLAGDLLQKVTKPLSDATGMPDFGGNIADWSRYFQQGAKGTAGAIKGDTSGAGMMERGLYSGMESLGQNLLNLPMTILSGGSTTPMLASMSLATGGQAYGEARDKDLGIIPSLMFGTSQGAIEYATELLPALALVNNLKAKSGIAKMARDMFATEVPGEQVATLLQDLNEWAILNPDKPFSSYVEQRPAAAMETLIATIVGTGGMVVTAKGLEKIGASVDKFQVAGQNRDFLLALGDGVQASKLRERMPEKMQELIKAMKEEHGTPEHAYVDAQKLTELWQSNGFDPQQKASEMFSDPAGYAEALATGSEVAIPLEEFAARFTGESYYKALIEDVRLGTGSSTFNEAQEWDKTGRDQDLKDLIAEADGIAPTPSDLKIYDDVVGQLIGTGMERSTAERNALVMKSVFRTLAARTGQDAHELFKEYGLKVTRPLPEVLAKRLSVDMSLDPLLDKLREGKIPKDRDVRGKSLVEYLRTQGVRDDGGELKALDPDSGIKGKAKKLIKADGLEMDRARLVAIEDGYLPEGATIRDFLDAISNDLAGRGVYSNNNLNNQLMEDQLSLTQMKEYLDMNDIDLEGMTNEEIRAALEERANPLNDGREMNQATLPEKITLDGREVWTVNSEGKPISHTFEGISNFYKWFGDSEVVDKDGRPMVVYHGTEKAGFNIFDTEGGTGKTFGTGAFFAENERGASTYSGVMRGVDISTDEDFNPKYDGDAGNYAVYLKIESPEQVDFDGKNWDSFGASEEWYAVNEDGETVEYFTSEDDAYFYRDNTAEEPVEIEKSMDFSDAASTDDLTRRARDDGFDGIIMNNIMDEGRHGQGYGWSERNFVVFNPEQIKSADQNTGAFNPNDPNILNQSGAGPRLIVNHNLSSENLIFADKMGGLALPSLAITPEHVGHEAYGDILLIGKAELADPSKVPVLDADAYTTTFPAPDYPKVKSKVAQKLIDEFRPLGDKLGDGWRIYDALWDYSVNKPDPGKIISELVRFSGVKAQFLKETQGLEFEAVMMPKPRSIAWSDSKAWRDFVKSVDWAAFNDMSGSDPRQAELSLKAGKAALKAINEYVDRQVDKDGKKLPKKAKDYLKEGYIRRQLHEDGSLLYSYQGQATRDTWNSDGKEEIDKTKTAEPIDAALKGHESEFKSWVDEKVTGMFEDPRIKVNGKLVPYTLDNIVKYMTGQNLRSSEKTMTFGPGNARATASHQFKGLEEMREAADENIIPKDQLKAEREKVDALLSAWRDEVIQYYKGTDWKGNIDTWNALDDSMRALAGFAKNRLAPDALQKALSRNNFKHVPKEIIKQGEAAGRAMLRAPVPYFEAKPQRAVKLEEFAGAVIPSDASPEIRAILDKHGIKYAEYGARFDEAARHEVAAQLREELQASGQKVLFQAAYHGSPHTFDKFSTKNIGTGEGAQAYGYGLYFAGSKAVAEFYRDKLSGVDVKTWKIGDLDLVKNGVYVDYSPKKAGLQEEAKAVFAEEILSQEYDLKWTATEQGLEAARERMKKIGDELVEYYQEYHPEIVPFLEKLRDQTATATLDATKAGKMYHVELAPEESDYILWDKPLSGQSEKVKEALAEQIPDHRVDNLGWLRHNGSMIEGDGKPELTGRDIYMLFKLKEGGGMEGEKKASEFLHSIGIRGIKYLDGSSRSAGEGAHNYVIFSDDDVSITEMYQSAQGHEALSVRATQKAGMLLTATVRHGKVFVSGIGATHYDAGQETALEAPQGDVNGFVTPEGKFLDRQQALVWLRANRPFAYKALDSMTKKNGLESQDYAHSEGVVSETDKEMKEFMRRQFGQGPDTKRGFIRFGEDRQFNIGFLENADLSTFIHETGHFYFEVLGDLAGKDDAPQQIRDDFQKLLDHVGAASREEVTVAQHETLARSFEAYLMEGKAPSVELQGAFSRMKAWLVQVYKEIRKLNVKLNDDVRGVFDRLVASDEEIEAARTRQGLKEVFATAQDMGVSEAEFAIYRKQGEKVHAAQVERLEKEYLAELARENEKWWNDGLAKLAEDVDGETQEFPVYIAIQVLTKGVTFSGEVADLKLDRKTLEKQYGKTMVKRLPRGIFSKEGGLTADQVAEMTGFESGSEMVEAMITAPSRKEYVKAEAERRMRAQHGDMLTDGSAADEATLAVHTDEQAKVLHEELRAMRKLQVTADKVTRAKEGENRAARNESLGAIPPAEFFKDLARDMVAKKMIEELLPHRYQQAEAKAAREAFEAAAKKDWAKAAEAKQRQILNHYLYKEAANIKKMVDKQVGKWNDLVKKSDKRLAASRDMNIVTAARAVLAAYGIGDSPDKAIAALSLVQQYDPNLYESLQMAVDVATQEPKPWKKLQLTEFIGLMDAVNNLWHLSRRSKIAMIDGLAVGLDEINDNLILQIGGRDKPFAGLGRNSAVSDLQKFKIGFLGMGAALKRVEHWVVEMDRGDSGPFHNFILRPIYDAVLNYKIEKKPVIEKLREIFSRLDSDVFSDKKIAAPELGYTFKNKGELLHAILHTGNESNLKKLLVGREWADADNEQRALDRSKWDKFLERMYKEQVLTEADYVFAQEVWDLLESTKSGAQKAHHDMYGYYFAEITAEPVVTPFGTFRGGYVPAITDPYLVESAAERADQENLLQDNASSMFPATTGKGFTMSRVAGYNKPLLLDLGLMANHVDKVLRFSAMGPAIQDVGRIIGNSGLKEVFAEINPAWSSEMLVPWLKRTARQTVETKSSGWGGKAADAVFRGLRRRTGLQLMAANLGNAAQQLTGLFPAMAKVSPRKVGAALVQFSLHPMELTSQITDKSPWMRDRLDNEISQISGELRDILTQSKYEKAQDYGMRAGYWLSGTAQHIVDVIAWQAAYDENISEGEDEKESVQFADSVVRQTQGSFSPEDASNFEAKSPFVRLFTQFYSYFNMISNLAVTESRNAIAEMGWKGGSPKLFYIYLMTFALPSFFAEMIMSAMRGKIDDDDDGEYIDDVLRMFFTGQARAATALIPGVGQVINAAVGKFTKLPYDDRMSVSPAVSSIEGSAGSVKDIYDVLLDGKELKRAHVRDVFTLAGMLTGLPFAAAARPLGYMVAAESGKTQPANDIDYIRGLMTGYAPK